MFQIRLKELREKAGYSQQGFANAIGVKQSTVGNWEAGAREPKFEVMERLADFFGVSVDYLLGRDTVQNNTYTENLKSSKDGSKWIPVLGTVVAGIPLEAVEDIIDYEEISPQMAAQGDFFALQIKGDSMEPKISNGDVVIVREGIMLIPNNPAYEPMYYSNAEIESLPVRVIGKVVELRAKF